MTIVLGFVIFYLGMTLWDVVHVNDLVGRVVDPAGYRQAHPRPEVPSAPRLVINLPSTDHPSA